MSDSIETVEVVGLDHLYVCVSDLSRSERFHDPIMELLGFKKGLREIGGVPHVHYFNAVMQISLRPSSGGVHDPYRTGAVHHLCFRVRDAEAVDRAYLGLRALGVQASEPALYEYAPDYYATFFTDPDGVRLEIVNDTERRRMRRAHWRLLEGFVDPVFRAPLPAAGERRPKQVIVMRRDLGMRKGKLIAQGAHASLGALLERFGTRSGGEGAMQLSLSLDAAASDWLAGRFTKVCVYVQSESQLEDVFARARAAGLPCALIVDSGRTEFAGVPTKTCCAVGPAWEAEVDAITGDLPLY